LEQSGSTGEKFGWIPRHLVAYENNQPVGALALYEKDNSYGEFVFDWAWADAYQRNGLNYYPKLVNAAPYTPATGPRILVHPEKDRGAIGSELINAAIHLAKEQHYSSLHFLFTTKQDTDFLEQQGLMLRLGCQYHWQNRGYRDFQDYLDAFTSKKRKNIRQERRNAQKTGVEIDFVKGSEATDEQIAVAELFYRRTFDEKWGTATLNLDFFQRIAETMGEQLLFILARHSNEYVAGAICFQSDTTLYGRHWGCIEHFPHLHFELCYYQGLEYCIEHNLKTFEPGAQGEHKISRGFLPTPTWSAHWIENDQFRNAIQHFLSHETEGMLDYIEELKTHSPFKK
jgi:predicted N-acyltransferase